MDADEPLQMVGDLLGGSAQEVFMTEVLAANMIAITDKLNSLQETYSTDFVHEVEEIEKPPGLFGDVEWLPIDAERSEYDEIPNTSPELWLQRYHFEAVLTGESKALHEKAEVAYAKKQNARPPVNVVVVESDGSKGSGRIAEKKARWFDKFSEMTTQRKQSNSSDSSVSSKRHITSQKCKKDDDVVVRGVDITPPKRGRGRPPKDSRKSCSKLGKDVGKVQTRKGLGQLPKNSSKSSGKLTEDLFKTLPKRGRGRPPKKNGKRIDSTKRKYSNIEDAKSLNNPRKRGQPRKYLDAEFYAAELCGKCCVKVGKKIGQGIREKLLYVQIANAESVGEEEIVKRTCGRAKRTVAANFA